MNADEVRALEIPKTGGVNEDREATFILKMLREMAAQSAEQTEQLKEIATGVTNLTALTDDLHEAVRSLRYLANRWGMHD